jgi:thioredoxin reductase/NAD-dependent dihydropyrimidine dehydrogenase PreA subunit
MGGDSTLSLILGVSVGVSGLLAVAAVTYWRRVRFESRSRAHARRLREAGFTPPPTLHPVIDPARCIGCGACSRSCPHGDAVFGLIAGRGAVLDTSLCVGHGECASECPAQAIRLVYGTAERGVDIPELDGRFETNVPGLYIAGELGGMGLIQTAVRQAVEAVGNIGAALECEGPRPRGDAAPADVAIVGAGPAGLTAALAAIELGLTYRLLEQDAAAGGALRHYPRHKLVMTAPVDLPLLGPAFAPRMTKEQLVELWGTAIERHGVRIEYGVEVERVERDADGTFITTTSRGSVRSRKVLLCVGRRGKPRALGVPGEEASKVAYELVEPGAYAGQRMLVVGGGDSALEAACALAAQPGTQVTLAHRDAAFMRARPENRARLAAARTAGRLEVLLESTVQHILPAAVRLSAGGREVEIANDYVLVFAGGDPPAKLLANAGVELRRHYAEEAGGAEGGADAAQVFARIRGQHLGRGLRDHRARGRAAASRGTRAAAALGAALAAAMLWLGRAYYFRPAGAVAPAAARAFGPSGAWGHALGFVAAAMLLVNLAYLARKELPVMRRAGSIHTWLRVHIAAGLFAGGFALFHSTLASRNLFAVLLYLSMGTVVATGLIGRFLYGCVPRDPRGRPLAHAALIELSRRMELQAGRHFHGLAAALEIEHVLNAARPGNASLLAAAGRLVFRWPARYRELRAIVRHAGRELGPTAQAGEFRHYAHEMFRLRLWMDYLPHLKRLLAGWRVLHGALAVLLVALLITHVAVDVWVGYRWIF